MLKMETIPVVITGTGEVYFDDPFELKDNQWFQEGNCYTAEIPANEPSKEQHKLLSQFPHSGEGTLGMYLAYWDNIL